MLKTPELQNT